MTKKRGNSEGSISRRSDGRWVARLTLEDGKRKSYYAKTRQEASRLLAAAQRDRDAGLPLVSEHQTVEHYLTSWLKVVEHTLKERSLTSYALDVNRRIIPTLGRIPLAKLTAQQVQNLYAHLLEEGLSLTSVRHTHAVFHRAIENALRLGLVQRNVLDMVQAPRTRRCEYKTLTAEQAQHFLAEAKDDRNEALYRLALTTGMRQGELLALKWQDVNLDAGYLEVKATLYRHNGAYVFGSPKTESGRRRLMLTLATKEALLRHRVRQGEERRLLGEMWEDLDLVFPSVTGHPSDARDLVVLRFAPLLKKAELPRIRFHDLRHTAATLLLEAGVSPLVVSEMLGHADIRITLGVYGHVTPRMRDMATKVMEDLFKE